MQITDFIRQIPIQCNHAYQTYLTKGVATQQWISNYAKNKIHAIGQSKIWKQYSPMIGAYNFKALTLFDYALFAGSLITAMIGITFIVNRFTIGALPLAAGVGTLLVMGAFYLSRYRVHKHFNEAAWDHIDQIRQLIHITTSKNQKFADISQERANLMQAQFKRLDEEFKILDEEIRKFRNVVLTPHVEDRKVIIKAHLAILHTIIPNPSTDKNLLENLEKAIDKAGQQDEDLKEIETHKQNLANLQTPAALSHTKELKEQVDVLINTSKNANFQDSKKACIQQLEGLQNKLASYKTIPPLAN